MEPFSPLFSSLEERVERERERILWWRAGGRGNNNTYLIIYSCSGEGGGEEEEEKLFPRFSFSHDMKCNSIVSFVHPNKNRIILG